MSRCTTRSARWNVYARRRHRRCRSDQQRAKESHQEPGDGGRPPVKQRPGHEHTTDEDDGAPDHDLSDRLKRDAKPSCEVPGGALDAIPGCTPYCAEHDGASHS